MARQTRTKGHVVTYVEDSEESAREQEEEITVTFQSPRKKTLTTRRTVTLPEKRETQASNEPHSTHASIFDRLGPISAAVKDDVDDVPVVPNVASGLRVETTWNGRILPQGITADDISLTYIEDSEESAREQEEEITVTFQSPRKKKLTTRRTVTLPEKRETQASNEPHSTRASTVVLNVASGLRVETRILPQEITADDISFLTNLKVDDNLANACNSVSFNRLKAIVLKNLTNLEVIYRSMRCQEKKKYSFYEKTSHNIKRNYKGI